MIDYPICFFFLVAYMRSADTFHTWLNELPCGFLKSGFSIHVLLYNQTNNYGTTWESDVQTAWKRGKILNTHTTQYLHLTVNFKHCLGRIQMISNWKSRPYKMHIIFNITHVLHCVTIIFHINTT